MTVAKWSWSVKGYMAVAWCVAADAAGMKLLGKLIKRGDDKILRVISQFFAEHGVKTIPVNMFLAGRAMPSGHVAGPEVDDYGQALIDIGVSILDKLGACDVGQSVIVQNGRVLAIEAAEGTSAMLARSENLIDADAGPAVFVKMQKSEQDHRLDKPLAPKIWGCFCSGSNILPLSLVLSCWLMTCKNWLIYARVTHEFCRYIINGR